MLSDLLAVEGPPREGHRPRRAVAIDESTSFVCTRCSSDPTCFVCHKEKVKTKVQTQVPNGVEDGKADEGAVEDRPDEDVAMDEKKDDEDVDEAPLLFRCLRCHQACHYQHSQASIDFDSEDES